MNRAKHQQAAKKPVFRLMTILISARERIYSDCNRHHRARPGGAMIGELKRGLTFLLRVSRRPLRVPCRPARRAGRHCARAAVGGKREMRREYDRFSSTSHHSTDAGSVGTFTGSVYSLHLPDGSGKYGCEPTFDGPAGTEGNIDGGW